MRFGVRVAATAAVLMGLSAAWDASAQEPAEPPAPCPPGEFCAPADQPAEEPIEEPAEPATQPDAPSSSVATPALVVEQSTTPLASERAGWNASDHAAERREDVDDDTDPGDALFVVGAASFLTGYVPALVTAAVVETERDLAAERGEYFYDGGWTLLALPFEGPWIAALVQDATPTQWGLAAASSALQHTGLLLMIVGAVIEPDEDSDVAVTVAPLSAGPAGGGLSLVGVW